MKFVSQLAIFVFLCGLSSCQGSCPADYCCNGGSCNSTSTATSFFCDCLDGFNGSQCENDQDFCNEKCTYGTCMEGSGMNTTCLCPIECCMNCTEICNATTCASSGDLCLNATMVDDCTCQDCYNGTAVLSGECSVYTVSLIPSSLASSTPSTATTVGIMASVFPGYTTIYYQGISTTLEPGSGDLSVKLLPMTVSSTPSSPTSSTPSSATTVGVMASLTPSASSEPGGLSPAIQAAIVIDVIIGVVALVGVVLVTVYLLIKWFKLRVKVAPSGGDTESLLQEESATEMEKSNGIDQREEKEAEAPQQTQDTQL